MKFTILKNTKTEKSRLLCSAGDVTY